MKEKLKTVNIKGKEYVTVNERIRYFNEAYKQGSIQTEIINLDLEKGSILMKAVIYPDIECQERFFTGYAHEIRGKGMVNATSFIENCETSAVGRALGFLGIGVETSIASADEVAKALQNSPESPNNAEIQAPKPKSNQTPSKEEKAENKPIESEISLSGDFIEEKFEQPEELPEKPKKNSKIDINPVKQILEKNEKKNKLKESELKKGFAIMKKALGDEMYYDVLTTFNKKSANELKTTSAMKMVLSVMLGRMKEWK